MKKQTKEVFETLAERYPELQPCMGDIESAFEILCECYLNGGTVYTCGNGGSASDALHIVGELMKSFRHKRKMTAEEKALYEAKTPHGEYFEKNLERALPAVSLVSETSLLTAYSNDAAPDLVFAQQVFGYGRQGDVLWGISTSGNSMNVVYASEIAKAKGMKVFSLTGIGGGKLKALSDVTVAVPEKETFMVQELHLPVYHALCEALEVEFFTEG